MYDDIFTGHERDIMLYIYLREAIQIFYTLPDFELNTTKFTMEHELDAVRAFISCLQKGTEEE